MYSIVYFDLWSQLVLFLLSDEVKKKKKRKSKAQIQNIDLLFFCVLSLKWMKGNHLVLALLFLTDLFLFLWFFYFYFYFIFLKESCLLFISAAIYWHSEPSRSWLQEAVMTSCYLIVEFLIWIRWKKYKNNQQSEPRLTMVSLRLNANSLSNEAFREMRNDRDKQTLWPMSQ